MNNPTSLNPAVRFAAVLALGLVALLMLAQPSTSEAHGMQKAKLGADLTEPGIDAVDTPELCPLGGACTRVQSYYSGPPHAGTTPFAPFNGTVKKVQLIADNAGKLKIQMVKQGMGTESKVTREGPTIRYEGTGDIETFKVNVPVKHLEWIGFKTKKANTLTCDPTSSGEEHVYEPALAPGGPFTIASGTYQCTELISATVVKD